MEKIITFKNTAEAIDSLDNGGRFYNVLTKPHDEVVSLAEVGKVAGLFFEKQKAILFLELALSALEEDAKQEIISKFDKDLQATYNKHKPQWLLPSMVKSEGVTGVNTVITGIPHLIDSNSELNGFIFIPAGKALVMVPIFDEYDIYEIRDEQHSETFIIGNKRGKEKLPEKRLKVGGVLKEMKAKKEDKAALDRFLEINYFVDED